MFVLPISLFSQADEFIDLGVSVHMVLRLPTVQRYIVDEL